MKMSSAILRFSSPGRHLPVRRRARRAFTLVEVMVAAMITAMVLGSMSLSLGQLGRARNTSKMRFDAHLRADAALSQIRRDVIGVIRTDDLFFTRVLLYEDSVLTAVGEQPRDDLLLFATRLRPVRDIDNFNGEGIEYETQYRIDEDDLGPVLWQRRDAVPDEYPSGGGMATPLVEGVVGLEIEAYDGIEWHAEWDSDVQGLPLAISIAVYASGEHDPEKMYERSPVILRTVVPIDRVLQPRDHFEIEEQALREIEAAEAAAAAGEELDPGDLPGLPDASGRGGGTGSITDLEGDGPGVDQVLIDGEAVPTDRPGDGRPDVGELRRQVEERGGGNRGGGGGNRGGGQGTGNTRDN